jgi:hypothetical protein
LPDLSRFPDSFVGTAERTPPQISHLSSGRMIFISLFIVFYYAVAGFWNSPPGGLRDGVINNFRVVADLFAFEQTWNMFGPPVRKWNGHYFITVTFADGSFRICEMPRMEKMSFWEKFRREKLRKLFMDNLPNPQFAGYLPQICANLALANANPKNPPVLSCLTFKWANMADPDEKKAELPSPYEHPEHTFSRTDMVYRVSPEDLQ